MAARKSPQEKKVLSYAKDRRNDYGENDKSSRKAIRRNKRVPNRTDRHREQQLLTGAIGPVTGEAAEFVQDRLLARKSMWRTKRWRKWPDAALAEVVVFKLRRRARLGMSEPGATEDRVDRIRRKVR